MTWSTISVTRQSRGDALYALTDDPRVQYASKALLLQADGSGATRVVIGFADGVDIVPAEQLPGWNGRLLTPLEEELFGRVTPHQAGAE